MTKRKTIRVSEVLNFTNTYLRNTDDKALNGSPTACAADWKQRRLGICTALEEVLHRTGNYHGYYYVTPHEQDDSSRHYWSGHADSMEA